MDQSHLNIEMCIHFGKPRKNESCVNKQTKIIPDVQTARLRGMWFTRVQSEAYASHS